MSGIQLRLDLDRTGLVVNPNVYGHFAEHLGRGIYGGIWVGEDSEIPNTRGIRNDAIRALRELNIPVLRWPGGCFADEYHWKDGVGPREARRPMLNTHWGRVVESNHFGTHEFFDLCELVGAEPYVCGNVGSGAVQEMMEWVEYMTSDSDSPMANWRRQNGRAEPWKLPFFGVGNESWGCGGDMRPEYYADEFRRYNCFVKNYSGNQVYRIACGANADDYRWTEVMMERAGRHMNGLSLHYYTLLSGWPPKGSATDFVSEEWSRVMASALRMEEILRRHIEIMDRFDPERRIGLLVDEWGTWFEAEPGSTPGFLYQQNSLRDAVVAALTLHLFHAVADRVVMANIAQLVNVLQAMLLTDGARLIRTPTYWVFEMMKGHQGGAVIPVECDIPRQLADGIDLPVLSCSATRKDGVVLLSVANLDSTRPHELSIPVSVRSAVGRLLGGAAIQAHNTFEASSQVAPTEMRVTRAENEVVATVPAHSVATIELEM